MSSVYVGACERISRSSPPHPACVRASSSPPPHPHTRGRTRGRTSIIKAHQYLSSPAARASGASSNQTDSLKFQAKRAPRPSASSCSPSLSRARALSLSHAKALRKCAEGTCRSHSSSLPSSESLRHRGLPDHPSSLNLITHHYRAGGAHCASTAPHPTHVRVHSPSLPLSPSLCGTCALGLFHRPTDSMMPTVR